MTGSEKPCNKCAYRAELTRTMSHDMRFVCDYIGHTGRARGCPPGGGCDKFKPLEGRKRSLRDTEKFCMDRSRKDFKEV